MVNNVETLAAVPWIVRRGGEAYARRGPPAETGTKLVCLSERFARPGCYEVELGTPVRRIVTELGGDLKDGAALAALQVGGPLGGFLAADALDVPLTEAGLSARGAALAGTRWRSSSPLCRLGPSLRATPANWPMSASRWASPPRRRRLPEAGAGTTPTRTSTWTGTCASPAAGVYGCAPRCRGPSPSPWSAGAATRSWPRAPVGPGPSRTAWPAAAVSTPVPWERSSSRDRRAASPPGSGPRRPGRAPPAATAAWAAPSTWSPRTARSRQCCPPGTAQSTTDTPV